MISTQAITGPRWPGLLVMMTLAALAIPATIAQRTRSDGPGPPADDKIGTGPAEEANADDQGFSLVEVVVAMVVFAVMVSAALGILIQTFDVTRDNTHRVVAANLATKQIESARSQLAIKIPDGASSRTEVVAGTTYTITQNANYVVSDSETSLCESTGGQLAHKLVTVEVTWPDMGTVKPVRSDTVRALGVGSEGLDEALGSLAIGVSGANGDPVAGVVVTIMPGNYARTTGIDGCAVFVGLPVPDGGTDYTASVNQVSHVGANNERYTQVVEGVVAGLVSQAELLYDVTRTLNVQVDAAVGYTPPTDMPVSVRSSYVDSGMVLLACASAPTGGGCSSSLPGQASNLFPAVYDVWAGECPHPRPVGESGNVDLVDADGNVTLQMRAVQVRLLDEDGVGLPGLAVTATGGCSGTAYLLAPTSADGTSRTALPPGTWTFSTTEDDIEPVTMTIPVPVTGTAISVELKEDD